MGKTLSFGKGKGNVRHNNREYITPNVDQSRLADNVYLVKQDIRDAYEECFGQAIADYNATQKRSDRKKSVDGYMDEIKRNQANRNGEKLFYEQVVGVGDMHDSGIVANPAEAEKCKSILLDYFSSWQERNPNLHVFNAVLHMDEATPHLHIDYIPVGEGYKQGIQARNSLTRAFENMGIDSAKTKGDNATIKWQERERGHITDIAKGYGVEIDVLGIKRQDYTIDEYKAIVRDEKQALKQIEVPKVKRTIVPIVNVGIEWNPGAVDKALNRKTKLREHSASFKQATQEAERVVEHVKEGLEDVEVLKGTLEQEKAKYEAMRHDYERIKSRLPAVEEQNRKLEAKVEELKQDINRLQKEPEALKLQIGKVKGLLHELKESKAFNLPKPILNALNNAYRTFDPYIYHSPELVDRMKQADKFVQRVEKFNGTVHTEWDWTPQKAREWSDLKDEIEKAGFKDELSHITNKSKFAIIKEQAEQHRQIMRENRQKTVNRSSEERFH